MSTNEQGSKGTAADLEQEVDADLAETAEAEPKAKGKGKKAEKIDPASFVGRQVSFHDHTTDVVMTGEAMKVMPSGEVRVRVGKESWDVEADQVNLVEGKAESGGTAEKPKAKSKKGETPAAVAEEGPQPARERRVVPIDSIVIPKALARGLDKGTDQEWAALVSSLKKRQDKPVVCGGKTGWSKLVLVNGLRRYTGLKEAGATTIEVELDERIESDADRIFYGILDNEQAKPMSFLDLGKAFVALVKDGTYSPATIAKRRGITERDVQRYIAVASKLPEEILAAAMERPADLSFGALAEVAEGVAKGDDPDAKAGRKVLEQVKAAVAEKRPVTISAVRDLKAQAKRELKKADKPSKTDGDEGGAGTSTEPPASSRSGSKGGSSITHADLSKGEIGDQIRVRVKADQVELHLSLPWNRKTFKGLDLLKEIGDLFDAAFAREGDEAIQSFEALAARLTDAKGGLVTGETPAK